MGMDRKVVCDPARIPSWPALAQFLAQRGFPVQVRMIDGELAFPDEEPKPDWRELRLGTPGGMLTLRREVDGVSVVVWSNADDALRSAWHEVASALAALAQGRIE